MTESLFGPLVSTWQIEQAVITTFKHWLDEYLSEVERKNGLPNKTLPRPPGPESFHGGNDFQSWRQDTLPEMIVVVKPQGEPERSSSAGYVQNYRIEIGFQWIGDGSILAELPEDEARGVASMLGAASMLLVQESDFGGLAERIIMVQAPAVTFPDPEQRALAQVVTGFDVWIAGIVNEALGPAFTLPGENPEYPGEPEEPWKPQPIVKKVHIHIQGEREEEEGGLEGTIYPSEELYPSEDLYPSP